jgi:hypothetical protein
MNIKAVTLFAAIASALAAIGLVYNDVSLLMMPGIHIQAGFAVAMCTQLLLSIALAIFFSRYTENSNKE